MINTLIFQAAEDVVERLALTLWCYSHGLDHKEAIDNNALSLKQLQLKLQHDKSSATPQNAMLAHPVHISLSGGSTPKMLFKRLASEPYASSIQWQNLHFWWGDERCVAPEDAESNFGEANELLFNNIVIPAGNIHRIHGEADPKTEVERFTQEMKNNIPCEQGIPIFDWILLGVGADGHTASLFPNATNYHDKALALVAFHPESKQARISKSATILNAAKRISYLVLGENKAEIVNKIYTTPAEMLTYPAAHIRSTKGTTEWFLDSKAAMKIAEGEKYGC